MSFSVSRRACLWSGAPMAAVLHFLAPPGRGTSAVAPPSKMPFRRRFKCIERDILDHGASVKMGVVLTW
jgi:hypothetical protein